MTTPHQDIALFKAIQQGERLALTTLFTNYYELLCQFAYQYLHNKEEAEEVVSEVFVQLWKSRERLSIDKSVKGYLYVSVKRASIAYIKSRQPLFKNVDEFLNISDQSQPESAIEFVEIQQYFDHAVNQLPVRCKQIFILNRFDNLKYREISTVLNISEKTVEHQIAKALSILRETMQRYLREPS